MHRNPSELSVKSRPLLALLNKLNQDEQRKILRPVRSTMNKGSAGGQQFNCPLPGHLATHGQRSYGTEYREYYGASAMKPPTVPLLNNRAAGTNVRPFDLQGTKVISNLVGEIYRKNRDPQDKTDVQRSWLPTMDPAVAAVNKGTAHIKQINFFDNATSLPLGEGMQPAFRRSVEIPGMYNRRSSQLTRHSNLLLITRK